MKYQAPVTDVLHSLLAVNGFADHYRRIVPEMQLDADTLSAIMREMVNFTDREVAPLNASGDQEGARWVDGEVLAPAGFAEAYGRYVDAGWPALAHPQDLGGQGLPYSVKLVLSEFLHAANHAWCMYSQLNDGAIKTLQAHAEERLQQLFLPKLISGEWTGTMCLTEPQAGTDLGLLRTRAEPDGTGGYRITGGKIFISSGEHDLASNIVHLVLARLPDAPPGVRGISLFIVSKRHIQADGSLGDPNRVSCLSIEEKMGLKGSATCTMEFDGAQGWLVGEPHRGLACMFVYINKSRLGVAMGAVSHAQAAHADSVRYALERLQGTDVNRSGDGAAAHPLIAQGDVRRMLLTQRAIAEGGRMLVHECARWVDLADYGDKPSQALAARRLALLTPIAKACLSELAFEAVDLAIQVYGGHGYIRDSGVEQRLRDARVLRIYEGTTGIQGMDLLGRKVLADMQPLNELILEIRSWCASATFHPVCGSLAEVLLDAVEDWSASTQELAAQATIDPELVGTVAVDYVMLTGYVLLAYVWARAAVVSAGAKGDDDFHAAKQVTARFYFQRLLPRRHAHLEALRAGSAAVMELNAQAFTL